MGPILKTLLGLFAFIWTVIGIVTLAGIFVVAIQAPKLVESLRETFSAVGTLTAGTTQLGADTNGQTGNQKVAPGLTPTVDACLKKELGANYMEKFQNNGQPDEKDQAAFEKCDFTPPTDAGQPTPQSSPVR